MNEELTTGARTHGLFTRISTALSGASARLDRLPYSWKYTTPLLTVGSDAPSLAARCNAHCVMPVSPSKTAT
jgi:hypothetical protein